ncbi:MAG: haloalkane dehalogenase [Chloroflexi bacterium]|nr:haloalkane dehalogenase [Chloroflexota bacterium]
MPIIRTPDEQFDNLSGFPFGPHYVEVNGLRVHHLDEGPAAGLETILCLHGEPTWSYLYRKMIPPLAGRHRVLAMDFIGFGRSDKYTGIADYSFQMHYDTVVGFIEAVDLGHITLVVQDWGGLIGLTVAADRPERFARLVILNTFLPTGQEPAGEAFLRWRAFAERLGTKLPVGRVIRGALTHPETITEEELAAYEAPFPDDSYKAGAAAFPLLVPLQPDDPGAAEMRQARQALAHWSKPALVMFSDGDPIMRGADHFFRRLIPTAADQPEITIRNAGHFLQEEKGEEIAGYILDLIHRESRE